MFVEQPYLEQRLVGRDATSGANRVWLSIGRNEVRLDSSVDHLLGEQPLAVRPGHRQAGEHVDRHVEPHIRPVGAAAAFARLREDIGDRNRLLTQEGAEPTEGPLSIQDTGAIDGSAERHSARDGGLARRVRPGAPQSAASRGRPDTRRRHAIW